MAKTNRTADQMQNQSTRKLSYGVSRAVAIGASIDNPRLRREFPREYEKDEEKKNQSILEHAK